MDTIESVIKELEDIKEEEGNLPVTWGDGSFGEDRLCIMVMAKTFMPYNIKSKRVCFSHRLVSLGH